MKRFLKIIKAFPAIFLRFAHVIEHIFCDEVAPIDFDEEDDI